MAASSSVCTDSRKRPRAYAFSADSTSLDFCDGVYSSCNKRRGPEIIQWKVTPVFSSSGVQPASASFFSGIPLAEEDVGSSYSRSHEFSVPFSSIVSALTDTADSTTGMALDSSLPNDLACKEQQLLCRTSSDEKAESCCEENDTSELDIAGFLLKEVWDDAGGEGSDFAFNPEAFFLNGANSTDCSEDMAFPGCSAENGNWFLNDLESEGHVYLNEVLDQEWMAAAVANLDRINDTLDADLCVLHLFESDHADNASQLSD